MIVPEDLKEKNERTDEEQSEKFLETIQLLLAAGYFRARIKGLSPFDKVVGGMVWCISTCDVDIDVDLLFQENSTIGQKIALTEKIVAVLPKMKCPHQIEPHQIQGLDFIHIFPVIQWLVKRAIETRQEHGDKIRAYSIAQFHKNHMMQQDIETALKGEASIAAVKTFKETYKPKRMHKKPVAYRESDEETQVYSTLLEYGQKYSFTKVDKVENDNSSKEKGIAVGLMKISETPDKEIEDEEKRINLLMEGMSEADIQQMLSSRTVGSIVGLKSDEISDIVQHYAQRQEALEQETNELKSGKIGGVHSHKRQLAAINNAVESEKKKVEETLIELEKLKKEFDDSKDIYNEQVQLKQRLEEEIEKLNEQENEHTSITLAKLKSLVTLNESLKKQEQDFKAECKLEKKELDEKIEELSEELSANTNAEEEQLKIIDEQLANDDKKLKKIRLLLAKKNREIASYQWKIDDVPSRTELAQYQRRFIELYNQVASTHKETKQFYSFYNTLDDKKLQLEKEISILHSIHDGFAQAYSSSTDSKNEFIEQLEKITMGVKQNEMRAEKKKQSEKEKRDNLNEKCMEITEKQRLYFKTVREFQEECKKSELIQAKLQAAGEEI